MYKLNIVLFLLIFELAFGYLPMPSFTDYIFEKELDLKIEKNYENFSELYFIIVDLFNLIGIDKETGDVKLFYRSSQFLGLDRVSVYDNKLLLEVRTINQQDYPTQYTAVINNKGKMIDKIRNVGISTVYDDKFFVSYPKPFSRNEFLSIYDLKTMKKIKTYKFKSGNTSFKARNNKMYLCKMGDIGYHKKAPPSFGILNLSNCKIEKIYNYSTNIEDNEYKSDILGNYFIWTTENKLILRKYDISREKEVESIDLKRFIKEYSENNETTQRKLYINEIINTGDELVVFIDEKYYYNMKNCYSEFIFLDKNFNFKESVLFTLPKSFFEKSKKSGVYREFNQYLENDKSIVFQFSNSDYGVYSLTEKKWISFSNISEYLK